MKVADVTTKDVRLISPDQTLREAAHLMSEEVIRCRWPITTTWSGWCQPGYHYPGVALGKGRGEGEGGHVGAVEVLLRRRGPRPRVQEYGLDLPVMNRDERLVGIVSLGDLAVTNRARAQAEQALHGVSPTVLTRSGVLWSHL